MMAAIEIVAFCDMCESISVPSCVGEKCDDCEEGFYEEFFEQECTLGESCDDDLHHHGLDAHIGRPEDFDKEP